MWLPIHIPNIHIIKSLFQHMTQIRSYLFMDKRSCFTAWKKKESKKQERTCKILWPSHAKGNGVNHNVRLNSQNWSCRVGESGAYSHL